MKELRKVGLYGDGLILIDSLEMVKRYNECLDDMGLERTKKKKFHIDRIGWSPEIAEELGNNYYLSYGEANPLAIILTPKQGQAPIYFPFHSFDWALMQQWFDNHMPQIIELTRVSGIWLDIDQEVEDYQKPEDLLMVGSVIVRAHTPDSIMSKVRHQKDLVRSIFRENDVFSVGQQAMELVKSAEDVGDMRRNNIVINEMHFSNICTFFTRALGGTFILCGGDSHYRGEPFVLNKNVACSAEGVDSAIDRSTLTRLEEMGLISYDLEWWKDHIHRLKIIKESFVMEVLDGKDPEMDFTTLNSARQKGILWDIADDLPKEYAELNRLIHAIEKGRIPEKVSECIKPFLAHPPDSLRKMSRQVIWHILALICDGRQIVRLYLHDKDYFFDLYKTWNTPRKSWARYTIKKYYEHHHMK